MDIRELVVATGNKGKLAELRALLSDLGITVRSQDEFGVPEVEETGLSFIENAIIKARHASMHTGLAALADDSGLAVDALGGAPGVRSARYSGEGATDLANNQLLLERLADVPDAQRVARFHCALALLRSVTDPVPIICCGSWEGRILRAPRGEGGFGYDPLFLVPDLDRTSAELPAEQKNRLSHRARAFAQLRRSLQAPAC